ncbi:lipid phosphate phosphatase, putative [Entamoeba histolytica HM-1:IMSS-B]|uniref:Lipid phosphate phosphatase, putative n=6 Tax=Entamoeba histolytica TaxID=5759 RepID=C4M5X2_ENTH1|nr:lipid phosphate phosphatase, putative [Entamoeba histolytica HM-1:IMSS]EMD47086.1 lipid phosphate phosphatase, putative [Entamoeba histolytica KU27]EMH76982.1 lipid phosphate phosphatase, putative [Entamoeba histolytica HM-1:IMSS-B]ENY61271.1 lipid phosphate phosphatase, putative [Entamoeba histolytica HM-1:IMSS-A]GAT96843.1 lipid phosphate phosphatase putative [Entamoeba histolytica]EAL47196.1 lipid phosphate phosphatase, putative [Entamoeba histolytica HM-1:IMSS]|eukprot:XP_652582.1 lipid phosphate phosphatase, putative [Entamoeba histolytica HM-1:IMSS]
MDILQQLYLPLLHKSVLLNVIYDIVVIVIFVIISIVCVFVTPHHMDIPKDRENVNVLYPLYSSSVPTWACIIIGYIPPVLTILLITIKKKSSLFLLFSLLSLGLSASMCLGVTNMGKIFAGRPRPHFYARIDAKPNEINDAYMSFPSGHSSAIFNGMTFLALLIAGQIHAFSIASHESWRMLIVLLPFIIAGTVAISRTRDYHHNFSDIIAGSLIGIFFALLSYCSKFKRLSDEHSDDLKIEDVVKSQEPFPLEDEEKQ